MKKSLKQFNPDKVAELELRMWRAYYERKFYNLIVPLISFNKSFFSMNYFEAIRTGYYMALALTDFRLNKGKENKERILKRITKFYKIISKHSVENFDYKKVSELELEWWFVDRYPNKYKITREESLANAMSSIYNIETSKLMEYAKYRAEGMELYDQVEDIDKIEVHWDRVGGLLKKSFNSLFNAINN